MKRYIELEDFTGSMEVLVFPSLLRQFEPLLQTAQIVVLDGNLDIAEDTPPNLRLESAKLLQEETQTITKRLYLRLENHDAGIEAAMKSLLRQCKGKVPVVLHFAAEKETLAAPESLWINPTEENLTALKEILGDENVKLVEKG